MADAKELIQALINNGAGLFTGVPDSLLSKLSACVLQDKQIPHIIAANEGNAIGLAIGDYLATKRPGVVYMQNSGLGNVVNPISSLADPAVYGIPMMLVIGWRGEPGVKDEPQHVKQGEITLGQLNILNIPFAIVSKETDIVITVNNLWKTMIHRQGPVALVVRKGAIGGDYPVEKKITESTLKREKALEVLINNLPTDAFFVATTGKTGRELFELREAVNAEQRDFLTVGGMGHASCIALGVALNQKERWTVCLDGDGAALMHLGSITTVANSQPSRFMHVLLNNYAHESVGGQPTIADGIDFQKISQAVGYTGYRLAQTEEEIIDIVDDLQKMQGCWFVEIRLAQGSRPDLGRPKRTPQENKEAVMVFLEK